MKVNRTIIIEGSDIPALFEELNEVLDVEITGIDPKSDEGISLRKKYPHTVKMHTLLKSEVMKEQSTFNYERIG